MVTSKLDNKVELLLHTGVEVFTQCMVFELFPTVFGFLAWEIHTMETALIGTHHFFYSFHTFYAVSAANIETHF